MPLTPFDPLDELDLTLASLSDADKLRTSIFDSIWLRLNVLYEGTGLRRLVALRFPFVLLLLLEEDDDVKFASCSFCESEDEVVPVATDWSELFRLLLGWYSSSPSGWLSLVELFCEGGVTLLTASTDGDLSLLSLAVTQSAMLFNFMAINFIAIAAEYCKSDIFKKKRKEKSEKRNSKLVQKCPRV